MTRDPFEPLETARLRLRCVSHEDALVVSQLMTPEISRWVASWPIPFTGEMASARIKAAREMAYAGDALPFAVIPKESGELIGWVTLNRDDDDQRRGSFGYWLGEAHHGKGYMRELAPSVLAASFHLLDLDVIEAGAQPENAASLSIMRACGMEFVGERLVYAHARNRNELCHFYEIRCPSCDR